MTLRRFTPLRPSAGARRTDPVDPAVRLAVLTRDGGCVAVTLGEPPSDCRGRLTLDHVKDGPGGFRPKSDVAHLVAICEGHSERQARAGYQWNTAHRPELREYLRRVNDRPHEHVEEVFGCSVCWEIAGLRKAGP